MLSHRQLATLPGKCARRSSHVVHVATPSRPPASRLAKRSKVEIIKEQSDFLRHPLMKDLVDENTFISEEAMQLMKFHGSYQQDHREKRAFGQGKFYQFMMRTRQPGGVVTNQLYLAMDDLADKVRRPNLHDVSEFPMAICVLRGYVGRALSVVSPTLSHGIQYMETPTSHVPYKSSIADRCLLPFIV
jgi:hypothetical protein